MANFNKTFQNMSQQWTKQSVSWGSLTVWVVAVAVLLMMMVSFSHNY